VALPALLAQTPKPVEVNHDLVEVCRLESEQGIALVILNWTDEPIQTLNLKVSKVGSFRKVTSAQGSPISSQSVDNDTLSLQMPIEHVDVLLIE
jgi:hypothetical protein